MAELDFNADEIGLKQSLWTSAAVDSALRQTFTESDMGPAAVLLSLLVGPDSAGDDEMSDLATYRLMLAALKLSGGDLRTLELWIEVAMRDPRDLIAAAEYPRELVDSSEESRQSDLAEYVLWIAGPEMPAN
ncbi:MAG: hypothetical protein CVT60_01680 [Actinobacteria bacterium HGW-Actinobacteria-10]|nr:MAG: hypothetical protein CVT60_01680 [Actinobacteria bacterium HGW-Actinobacteria-10]